MRVIFLGPPGAGKGTQSQNICRDYGIKQISTGEILRHHTAGKTPLGLEAASYMNKGELVPDNVMIDIIVNELNKPEHTKGFMLDGFPRTIPQAQALDGIMVRLGIRFNAVLVLEVPHSEIVQRISLRRTDRASGRTFHLLFNPPPADEKLDLYQREDDKEEIVKKRLQLYESSTKPLIKYYSSLGLAHKINGIGSLDDVYTRIVRVLDKVH